MKGREGERGRERSNERSSESVRRRERETNLAAWSPKDSMKGRVVVREATRELVRE